MGLISLLKSGIMLDIYFFKNNKSELLSMLLWPYLMLGLILGAGMLFGSTSAFKQNTGLNADPIIYFIASTIVAMAAISVMWEVGGNILFLRWIGALPYVLLAPHRISTTLILSYIPRYLFLSLIQLLEFAPIIILVENLSSGVLKILVLALAIVVGMLPLLGFSALFASILISIKEETHVLSWLNPLILLFSGALYPAYLLPYWTQVISWILPSTYTIELARLASIIGSPQLAPITFLIGVLLGMTIVYNSLAYILIDIGERKALGKGAI